MTKPMTIAILSNAGGVGKTTLSTHLAYELGVSKKTVVLIDLDPQRALDVFCGLEPCALSESTVGLFLTQFSGNWTLKTVWGNKNIQVCQGHTNLASLPQELGSRRRKEYILADRLNLLSHKSDVIIIDCPATLGLLCENAIAAADFLLIPVQLEMKSLSGLAYLQPWLEQAIGELALDPPPKILGLVPSLFDASLGIHRQYLPQLQQIGEQMGIKVYPPIRAFAEFKNASARGIPIHQHRPTHTGKKDFQEITKDILNLTKPKNG